MGKSTLTAALSREREVQVFRMRESAWSHREVVPGLSEALLRSDDPLGWVDDKFVEPLLRESIPRILALRPELVVFENFPGNASQVTTLHTFLATLSQPPSRLTVVELVAPPDQLRSRIEIRRVCVVCEPDLRGEPHAPASGSSGDPERCDSCGAQLRRRSSDEFDRFEARLSRYTSSRSALVERFLHHGVEVHRVSGLGSRRLIARTIGTLLT
ncbi:MAG TPA: hypothetical protein VHR18_09890 [Solirubrobacterales bacterium]|nr:hypothetical protein [Solirubrobacterales bacterium]